MRLLIALLALLCAPALAACQCNPTPDDGRVAAAPVKKTNVYTPPCGPIPEGHVPYEPSDCDPFETLIAQLGEVKCPFRGIGIPGLDCETPGPVSLAPEAPRVAAPAPQEPHCGPLPPDAKPGEVWCCVYVQPPAAPPQRVCTCEEKVIEIPVAATYKTVLEQVPDQPARVEWQRVECPPVNAPDEECWVLKEIPATFRTVERTVEVTPASVRREVIPAQFEMRASTPPPGYWEWRLNPDCKVPTPVAAPLGSPPAGDCALEPLR